MSGHSKGPWKVHRDKSGKTLTGADHYDAEYVAVVSADGEVICDNAHYYPVEINPEDAPVIAEAPAMLEMLETMLALRIESIRSADFGHTDNADDPDMYPEVFKARAIIARVKGEA